MNKAPAFLLNVLASGCFTFVQKKKKKKRKRRIIYENRHEYHMIIPSVLSGSKMRRRGEPEHAEDAAGG